MTSEIIKQGTLLNEIKVIIHKARYNAFQSVNREMLKAYFEVGRKIVEEEQEGKERAEYGKQLLKTLSGKLTEEFGRGFSVDSLANMRRFYLLYKNRISESVTRKSATPEIRISDSDFQFTLTWTHYCELIKIEDETKRLYFEKYATQENLSVRELKRQIYSLHYERLLLSKDKKELIALERDKFVPKKVDEMIKDPYVLEFLNLDEKHQYTEQELETKILDDLQKFLLELGQGFSFVARQKRVTIDNDHFYIDLLFYNIYLKCYIVVELKIGKFKHGDVGQMNFYLNYVKNELNKEGDNAPVGIVLCTEKNNVQVEYTLSGLSNQLFVSKYKLYLPTKEELEQEIKKLI